MNDLVDPSSKWDESIPLNIEFNLNKLLINLLSFYKLTWLSTNITLTKVLFILVFLISELIHKPFVQLSWPWVTSKIFDLSDKSAITNCPNKIAFQPDIDRHMHILQSAPLNHELFRELIRLRQAYFPYYGESTASFYSFFAASHLPFH